MLNDALMCLLHTPIQSIESFNALKKKKKGGGKVAEWITDVRVTSVFLLSPFSCLSYRFPSTPNRHRKSGSYSSVCL